MQKLAFILTLFLLVPTAAAQSTADTESVDAIITAVYDVISGPKGERRDWDRFRNLFVPNARLIPVLTRNDTTRAVFNTLDEYIAFVDDLFYESGFFEIEIARKTEQYGHILHAFSTYESRRLENDEKPFARGINSFQLMHDGNRWWVVNIMWDDERGSGETIPATYLPN